MPRDDGAERWNLMWRSQDRWLVERSAIEHCAGVDWCAGDADRHAAGSLEDRQAGRDIPDRRARDQPADCAATRDIAERTDRGAETTRFAVARILRTFIKK